MTGLGEAFTALKNIALLHERVANLRGDVDELNGNLGGLRDYAVAIDKRLARLEGYLEGAAAASRQQFQLPKE